jgi:hypothetical protein
MSVYRPFREVGKRRAKNAKRVQDSNEIKGASVKLPRTGRINSRVLPNAGLLSLIPESAARKYTAGKPFSVHLNDGISESLIVYFGKRHIIFT